MLRPGVARGQTQIRVGVGVGVGVGVVRTSLYSLLSVTRSAQNPSWVRGGGWMVY